MQAIADPDFWIYSWTSQRPTPCSIAKYRLRERQDNQIDGICCWVVRHTTITCGQQISFPEGVDDRIGEEGQSAIKIDPLTCQAYRYWWTKRVTKAEMDL